MARTIMIEGPSGRGKSFSLRNLPPKYTLIANHERKTLPFKGAEAFPQARPLNVKETFELMDKAIADPNVKIFVTESLSAFLDMLLAESRILKKGFDIYSYYNEKIYYFFERVRKMNDAGKHVIVISHDDVTTNELTGDMIITAKVKGTEWKGVIEKEFDIVLHSEMIIDENKKPHFKFRTITDGVVPAKAPYEMFASDLIDNDMAQVLKAVAEYDKA